MINNKPEKPDLGDQIYHRVIEVCRDPGVIPLDEVRRLSRITEYALDKVAGMAEGKATFKTRSVIRELQVYHTALGSALVQQADVYFPTNLEAT